MLRKVPCTRLSWESLSGWLDLVFEVGGVIRCSRVHYERCDLLYGSLQLADILFCSDLTALERAEDLFDRARYNDVPSGRGLGRVWTREHLGGLLVETRNRLDAVRSGRAFQPRRFKGPRLDPVCLPDAALDRLIQTHSDLQLVERLRQERRRRQLAA